MANDTVQTIGKYVIALTALIGCFVLIAGAPVEANVSQNWAIVGLIVGWIVTDNATKSGANSAAKAIAASTATPPVVPPTV